MRLTYATALILGSFAAAPVLAQTAPVVAPTETAPVVAPTETAPVVTPAETAPATAPMTAAPSVTIVAPEGYTVYDFTAVTADELKGLDLYDAEGNNIAEISDLEIGAENSVNKMLVDVGGFLGMGVHTVALTPEQLSIYRNADGDLRGYVMLDKAALEALPEYTAPAQ